MPAADDLFRPTATPVENEPAPAEQAPPRTRRRPSTPSTSAARSSSDPAPGQGAEQSDAHSDARSDAQSEGAPRRTKRSSGRVRHDEKMTVYVTADELLELEHARLSLRRETGVAVDRGRLVREAIAIALADLEANGEDSVLVRRLTQS
ncbi:MAG TPA: hypothetical protein VLA97_04480 [Nocardioidaceae bacterium]|nr:hypothetical protein [Nocardioidaceae bacterium]